MSKRSRVILLLFLFIAAIIAIWYSPVGTALTIENLKQHRDELLVFVRDHYAMSVGLYIVLYTATTAFSIPGAAVLTLSGGFLFNTVPATLYVNIGATAGAVLAFLSARYLMGEQVQGKYQQQLSRFNREMETNGYRYLLALRLVPVFPFFLINFLSGLTTVPLRTFAWTTSLGIIPATVVYAFAGRQLGSITSLSDILSAKVIIAFSLLALFAIIPAVMDRLKNPGHHNP